MLDAAEHSSEVLYHLIQIVRRLDLLQPRHSGRQLALIVRLGVAQVNQHVALRWLEGVKHRVGRAGRDDQIAHVVRGGPAGLAVVEDHRQHQGQLAGIHLFRSEQFAVQHHGVLVHPQRHRRVAACLEFQQHQHVGPGAVGAARADAPHGIAVALLEVVADVLGGHLFQRAQVQRFERGLGHDAAQQVGDHLREGVDALVDGIAGGDVLLHAATVAAVGRRTCMRSPSGHVGDPCFFMPDIAHARRRTFARRSCVRGNLLDGLAVAGEGRVVDLELAGALAAPA